MSSGDLGEARERVSSEFEDEAEILNHLVERLDHLGEEVETTLEEISHVRKEVTEVIELLFELHESGVEPSSVDDLNKVDEHEHGIETWLEQLGTELSQVSADFRDEKEEAEVAIDVVKESMDQFGDLEQKLEALNRERFSS